MQTGQTVLVLRRLLAQLRDVMAGGDSAQSRLGKIVSVIANDMEADVCSVYVRRAGDVLELFATKGLNPTAVHRTRLRIGEGLIGEIAAKAKPLAHSDAQNHPSFAYRPETGEEPFRSFMGVPIVRSGRIVGVVAIQNTAIRLYTDEEVEALQTVAMVLTDLVGGGSLIDRHELAPEDGAIAAPMRLDGVPIHSGLGVGIAVLHQPSLIIRKIVAEDISAEHERLRMAVAEMHGALDDMLRATGMAGSGEHREILETYRMIAEDVGWLRRIGEAINTGLTAEAAVQKVNTDTHSRMRQLSDDYLKERVHDLEDLANRLLQHLLGVGDGTPDIPAGEDVILVGRDMGPGQLLDYYRNRLRGIILEGGSPTTHVAIVARALDIPFVGQVRNAISRIENGDLVIVDADHGQVFVRPSINIRQAFDDSLRARSEREASFEALKGLPAITGDGVHIGLSINAGLLVDLNHLDSGVDGVGLFRTEVPFIVQSDMPNIESQRQTYRKVLDLAGDKPVIFRTLDIGGDKVPYNQDRGHEENPAMGWRAIRLSIDRPAVLRQQMRALIQAAAGRKLSVMFPMISQVDEFDYARRLLDKELVREQSLGGVLPERLQVGAMLEVPSLVYQLPALLDRIDFLSVGTNDLLQFLFASDRSNYRISELYDELSPIFLKVLRDVAEQCANAGKPVSVCGEMASRPLDAMALLGIGFREISVSPPAVGPIKATIRSLNLGLLEKYMKTLSDTPQRSIRENLRSYAQDHQVIL